MTNMANNILSKESIRKTYPVCVLFAFVMNMTFSVDSIVAGKFLGTDAIAAIGIGTPFIGLMISVLALILQGCYLKLIQSLGRSDYKGTCRIYSSGIMLISVLGLAFMALCIFCNAALANAGGGAKAAEETGRLAALYIMSASGMIPFFSAGLLFQSVLASYGYQHLRMWCSLVNIVTNVIASIISILLLPAEVAIVGLGIGSAFGCFVQCLLAFLLVKKRCRGIHLVFFMPKKEDLLNILDMFRRGVPSSANSIIDSAVCSVINNIVLSMFASGTEVVALIVIVRTLKTIVCSFSKGATHASEPLFGILFNNRDVNGLVNALKDTLKIGAVYTVGIACLMVLVHPAFMSFYQQSGNQLLRIGLIMVSVAAPLFMVLDVLGGYYEATERFLLSMAFSIIPDSILYPIILVLSGKALGPTAVWVGLAFNGIVFLAVFYSIMMIATHRWFVPFTSLLIINKKLLKHIPSLDVSIDGEEGQISEIANTIQQFLNSANYSKALSYKAALCMEEIAAEYASFAKGEHKKPHKLMMDIKVFIDEENVEMILRSYDDLYNPLEYQYNPEDFSKIGVYMVQKCAKQIYYGYAYHLNIITVKLGPEAKWK